MRITSKGQVTIPIAIRQQLGLVPDSEVEFEVEGSSVRIVKTKSSGRGRAIVEHMKGRGSIKITTEELMALTRGED